MQPQYPPPPRAGTEGPERLWFCVLAACAGIGIVLLFNLVGPIQIKSRDARGAESVRLDLSRLLVIWEYYRDPGSGRTVNRRSWVSLQALMWIAWCVGLGDMWSRRRSIAAESRLRHYRLLPEDERTLLQSADLKPIYRAARATCPTAVVPTLIRRLVLEFRKSRSIERVNRILDSSLELFQHRLDLRYTLVRYLVWLIPTLGFLGTVIGIASAMGFVGSGTVDPENLLTPTTQKLAVAFYTTWLALALSSVLVLAMNFTQAADERLLNDSGQYCLDHLVLKLLEPDQAAGGTSAHNR